MNLAEQAKKYREDGNYQLALTYANASDSAVCLAERALALTWLGRKEEAYEAAKQAVDQATESQSNQVDCLVALGGVELSMGSYQQALKTAEAANQINRGDSRERSARIMFLLAAANGALGRSPISISWATNALEIIDKGRDRFRAEAYHALADAYHRGQQYSDAAQAWSKALELRRQCLHPMHPEVAINVDSMALTLRRLNIPKIAISLHQEALRIYQSCFDPDHPAIAASCHGLAQCQQRCGQFLLAKKNIGKALAISANRLGKDHPDTLVTSFELGRIEVDCGEIETGRARMIEAESQLTSLLEKNHPILEAIKKWMP